MGNELGSVKRTLVIKAGMTPQDVINSKEATTPQKKMAYVFDSDGVAGYSQREADVFNATLIANRGQNGVSLWTRYKDGSKKETKYVGDVASFKYAPKGEVKPYVVVKKQAPTTPKVAQTKSLATQIIQEFEKTGKGELKVECYDNGNIKSKVYKNSRNEVTQNYYMDGKMSKSVVRQYSKYEYKWITTEDNSYYANGNLKSSETKELYPSDHGTEKSQLYYENGKPKSSKIRAYNRYAHKWITTENNSYYANGNLESSETKELYPSDLGTEKTQLYYENGKLKLKVIKTGKKYVGMVETTHIEYDSNGNVIKNAKVTK